MPNGIEVSRLAAWGFARRKWCFGLTLVSLAFCHTDALASTVPTSPGGSGPARTVVSCFTDVGASLVSLYSGSVSWGDYDNDGDLDILLAGDAGGAVTKIYRNNGGPSPTFSDIGAGLTGVWDAAAWGDFDRDGDLDIAVAGGTGTGVTAKVYRNNGGADPTFSEVVSAPLVGVFDASLAWGDYDNDGDLDLVVTGQEDGFNFSSRLYRNSGGPDPLFSDIGAGLPAVSRGSVAWADYDRDGDLDLALSGSDIARVYRNSGGASPTFSDAQEGLTGVTGGALAWGDFDDDADPDLLVTGGASMAGEIYENFRYPDGTGFLDQLTSVTPVRNGSVAWGDYDNDGYVDILIAGYHDVGPDRQTTQVLRNSGEVPFVTYDDIGAGLPGVGDAYRSCSVAWGDYDNDGGLDILLAGKSAGFPYTSAKVFRNGCAAPNTPPTAPTDLSSSLEGTRATFRWNAAADAQTSSGGLSYNLRVGTAPGAGDVVSPMASASTGFRRIAALGNAGQDTSWTIQLPGPGTYYWSVQAIDGAYAGSPFAGEQIVGSTTGVETGVPAVPSFALAGANPVVGRPRFRLGLPRESQVDLSIFDVAGRRIGRPAHGELAAGYHEVTWNGVGGAPGAATTMYFARLTVDGHPIRLRFVVLR